MRHLILLFIALSSATVAATNELVVGEQGLIVITLPSQPNDQKCNIEVKFADGSSQDIEIDPTNPSASVSFTPTIAGTQIIQWDGKMKWRGLKSRPPCEGDGNISVTVRERAEILAERAAEAERLRIEAEWVKAQRAAEAERLRAQQAAETERLKLEAERLRAEREAKATRERNRRAITNLVTQLDTGGKKLCAFEYVRTKSVNPEQYENVGAIQWLDKLIGSRIVSAKMISEIESAVNVCNQFFSKERKWRSQTFEPPATDVTCTIKSGVMSSCNWTYRIYANDAWQNATAMQAMQAHIISGESYWDTALTEKSDAKASREKWEAELASQRAKECKNNPLKYSTCPGYKEAKAERDAELAKQAAEEQRRKQERLARQRAEEEKERKRIAKERASMKFIFESDRDMAIQQDTNRVLGKQLNTSRGENVMLGKVYVWSMDSSDWLNGGELHLFNDYIDTSTKVTCSISPSQGDKWMEKNIRRDVEMTGKIVSYSIRNGLVISPCKIKYLN
jgi:hypothetical protein